MCLKLFRKKKLNTCYNNLVKSVKISLEAPFTTEVFKKCVTEGDFNGCYELLKEGSDNELFKSFIENSSYITCWRRIDFMDREFKYFLDNIVYEEYTLKTIKEKGKLQVPCIDIKDEMSQGLSMNHVNINEPVNFISNSENEFFMDELDELIIEDEPDQSNEKNEVKVNCPGSRAGHSMVLDENRLIIYLFGGWDGANNLSDFWSYDIKMNKWKLISDKTEDKCGPSPRSCTRMVYNSKKNVIYIYGKYKDKNEISNDLDTFYLYDIANNNWEILFESTRKAGGPGPTYDHQMVIDNQNQFLYIFGGVKLEIELGQNIQNKYLSLWKLDLNSKKWENLYEFNNNSLSAKLYPRFGHSLLFDSNSNELIIIGGNRLGLKDQIPLFDISVFNINSKTIRKISHDFSKERGGPDMNLFSCAVLNSSTDEIYIFGGKFKDFASNNFWSFNLKTGKWKKSERSNDIVDFDNMIVEQNFFHDLYNNDSNFLSEHNEDIENYNTSNERNNSISNDTFNEPVPRFAHQMVLVKKTNEIYVFGGNANKSNYAERY